MDPCEGVLAAVATDAPVSELEVDGTATPGIDVEPADTWTDATCVDEAVGSAAEVDMDAPEP